MKSRYDYAVAKELMKIGIEMANKNVKTLKYIKIKNNNFKAVTKSKRKILIKTGGLVESIFNNSKTHDWVITSSQGYILKLKFTDRLKIYNLYCKHSSNILDFKILKDEEIKELKEKKIEK